MARVSIIIPAYNAERTIEETIHSVQQQIFQDWELIIINDGSKDKTIDIVQNIQDERIKLFSYENGGLPVARNRGITQATGEFITFLDADDLWTPDKLELQVAALDKHPDAGVAYSWTIIMWESEESVFFEKYNPIFYEGNVYPQLLLGNFIGHGSNIMTRKTAIDEVGMFDPTLKSCEDWDFYLRMAARWHFLVVPKYQIIYRKAPGSMTSKVQIMEEQGLLVIENTYLTVPPELKYLKNQSLANFYRYCADLYFNHSTEDITYRQAQSRFWQAIKIYPQILLNKSALKLAVQLMLRKIISSKLILAMGKFKKNLFNNPVPIFRN